MARVTVEDCLSKETNRFALVLLAAKRAKQLLSGSKLLIPETDNKQIVNSLREIAAGKVRFMTEEDQAKKRELEKQERDAALAHESSYSEREPKSAPALDLDSSTNGNGSSLLEETN